MVRNMTSNETDVWGHTLTNLIYRHLKKNGHKEAASTMRKHAPKVATKHVKVSLNDIFRQWMSEKQEKKNAEKCTDKNQIISNSKNSVSTSKTANIVAAGRKKDKKRKQNEESKKNINIPLVECQTSVNSSMQDDSDSSLDVDKWKKLALELSDTDIAKMDALTNFSTSSVASSDNSTKVPKAAKKDLNIHKGKSKLLNEKTEQKTAPSPSLTEKSVTPSKLKVKKPKNLSSNFETPTKNTKDRTTCSDSTELHSEDESTHSEANNVHVISLLPSDQSKTSYIGNSEPTETPSKKSKCKKDAKRQELRVVDMSFQRADNEVAHNQLTYDQANTSGHILGDKHIKTPSKNAKSKKSKPVDGATPSGEGGINEVFSYSKPYQTETPSKQPTTMDAKISVAPLDETPSGKVKKSFVGLNDTETPSKKKESQIDVFLTRVHSEPPSPSNISDSVISKKPHKKSKKSKRKRSDSLENVPSSVTETEWDHSKVDNDLILCNTSTQDQHEKFRKGGEDKNVSASAMEEGSPEPKKRKKNKKDKKSQIETDELVVKEPLMQPLEDLSDSLPCSQKKKKKKKNHKDVELQTMSTPSPKEQTPKKKKKSSKERTCTEDEAE